MKMSKYFTVVLLFIASSVFSQIPPLYDNNWVLNTNLSDEFNGTSLDLTKWYVWQNCDCNFDQNYCCSLGGSDFFVSSNVSVQNSCLVLEADAPIPPSPYTVLTGGIGSVDFSFQYGYIEIYAQLPGVVDQFGNGYGNKFWPAFWTIYESFNGTTLLTHNEIDIIDPGGYVYRYADTLRGALVDADENGNAIVPFVYKYYSQEPLCSSFHKYAAEWNTDRLIFYFDDSPIASIYNHPSLIMDAMKVIIDLQIDRHCSTCAQFDPNMTFPQNMTVDYFRYYQLRKYCYQDKTIITPLAFANYLSTPAVYRNITIGNNTTSLSINAGANKTIRASNEITIKGEFTVPLTAELNIIPTPCN